MEQSKCFCCFRDFSALLKSASKSRNSRKASTYPVSSPELRSFILENSEQICSKRKGQYETVEVDQNSRICFDCRSDFGNYQKKQKKVAPTKVTPTVHFEQNLDDPQPCSSRPVLSLTRSDSFSMGSLHDSLSESEIVATPLSFFNSPDSKRRFVFDAPNQEDSGSSSEEEQPSTSFNTGQSESEDEESLSSATEEESASSEESNDSETDDHSENSPSRNNIRARIMATLSSHSCCVFRCNPPVSLKVIPNVVRVNVIRVRGLFIPVGARCCESHLESTDGWSELQAQRELTSDELREIVTLLIENPTVTLSVNIPDPIAANEADYRHYTSLSVDQFLDLRGHISQPRSERNKTKYLFCFLMKIYHDLSDNFIAKLLKVDESTMNRWKNKILKELVAKFVPLNLGIRPGISRQIAQTHLTPISKALLLESTSRPNRLITIWDGTYIYHQKSANMEVQHRTYSGQKKTSLVKPMVVCFPDGYILDVYTLYAAVQNDASIMLSLFHSNDAIKNFFELEDVFVLDRGFRDVRNTLESKGFQVYMPCTLATGNNQTPWRQANENRIVTKNRWTVEAVNAQLKRFAILKNTNNNSMLASIEMIIKVCAALVNKYKLRLVSDQTTHAYIISRMKDRLCKPNLLAACVVNRKLNIQRRIWRPYDPLVENLFPRVDEEDVYNYACGSYVVKLLRAYKHHTLTLGELDVKTCIDNAFLQLDRFGMNYQSVDLYRVKIRSRYTVHGKLHSVYILVAPEENGLDKFVEHFCDCKSGLRTISCCNHVGVAIWLLGGGLELETQPPAGHLEDIALRLIQPTANLANEETDDAEGE